MRFSIVLCLAISAACQTPQGERASGVVRLALFNVEELSTAKLTALDGDGVGQDPQVRAAAAIVRRVRPDVLVVNEIDHDYAAPDDLAANPRRLLAAYLAQGEGGIEYPHVFAAPCNTGLLSGLDLDRDGKVATDADRGTRAHGGDCFGYGTYPGQFSMAVLSRLPIRAQEARTFQRFLWRDLPGHHLPAEFYPPEAAAILRLSSKSHWDVPVEIGDRVLHLLVSHPTPPVFDGDEDRNGRRNFDEIQFWVRYLADDPALYDDRGGRGGLSPGALFVLAGDLNADPGSREAVYDGVPAIAQLLAHPLIQDPGDRVGSRGAAAHAGRSAGSPGHPERATAEFGGGVRVDYLLPGRGLEILDGGVFWPAAEEDPEGHRLAEAASDHRLVWLDLKLPER